MDCFIAMLATSIRQLHQDRQCSGGVATDGLPVVLLARLNFFLLMTRRKQSACASNFCICVVSFVAQDMRLKTQQNVSNLCLCCFALLDLVHCKPIRTSDNLRRLPEEDGRVTHSDPEQDRWFLALVSAGSTPS